MYLFCIEAPNRVRYPWPIGQAAPLDPMLSGARPRHRARRVSRAAGLRWALLLSEALILEISKSFMQL